jgi:hypothetical protein
MNHPFYGHSNHSGYDFNLHELIVNLAYLFLNIYTIEV